MFRNYSYYYINLILSQSGQVRLTSIKGLLDTLALFEGEVELLVSNKELVARLLA